MSKWGAIRGVFKTLFWLTKEEWENMDRKLIRITFGVISFVAMALFWLYFLGGFGI